MSQPIRPLKLWRELTDFARQALVLLVLLVLIAAGWWIFRQYTKPQAVFEGMIKNNLSTTGVVRQSSQRGEGQQIEHYTQLSFVGPVASQNLVTITRGEGPDKSKVTTETLGTLSADYSRYKEITTNQKNPDGSKPDFSRVINIWGKTDDQANLQYLNQAFLGAVAFANLNGSNKSSLASELIAAYKVDYAQVKSETINGRKSWVYQVKLDTGKYIAVIKKISKSMGLGDQPALDPQESQGSLPISLTIAVDKLSRQLVKVTYVDGKQEENYLSYGLRQPIDAPDQSITFAELQDRLEQTIQ